MLRDSDTDSESDDGKSKPIGGTNQEKQPEEKLNQFQDINKITPQLPK